MNSLRPTIGLKPGRDRKAGDIEAAGSALDVGQAPTPFLLVCCISHSTRCFPQ